MVFPVHPLPEFTRRYEKKEYPSYRSQSILKNVCMDVASLVNRQVVKVLQSKL
jgi:hypothetical protein